jgi:hypothetical protein
MRRILAVVLLLTAGLVYAETSFNAVSVTNTSQYLVFPTPRSAVTICNDAASAGVFYFRLFNEDDTRAAAANTHSLLAVGSCISFSKAPTQASHFKTMAFIAASTATANIYSE